MGVLAGLLLGMGVCLIWFSFFPARPRTVSARAQRTRDLLVQSGVQGVSPAMLTAGSLVLALAVGVVVAALSQSPPIGLAIGAIAGMVPRQLVVARARRRRLELREVWPEVIDDLVSGIRAGLTLPEAVASVAERGPEAVREPFTRFAEDYRVSGRFLPSLEALKNRLADPVADRVVEALRLTHEVGGTDLGLLLRTLAKMIREDLRTRGELEARQSWTVNGARLAVAAPWLVLILLSTRGQSAAAYNTAGGVLVLAAGAALCAVAYRMMIRLGRLPEETRILR